MARVSWKHKYYSYFLLKCIVYVKINKKIVGKNKIIFEKTSTIPNNLIGLKFNIYKGCFFRRIVINKYIIGFKFGNFTFTRKPFKFISKSKSLDKKLKR